MPYILSCLAVIKRALPDFLTTMGNVLGFSPPCRRRRWGGGPREAWWRGKSRRTAPPPGSPDGCYAAGSGSRHAPGMPTRLHPPPHGAALHREDKSGPPLVECRFSLAPDFTGSG